MAMIEINKNPSRKELVVFAALLAAFLALVGLLAQKTGYAGASRVLWWMVTPVGVVGGLLGHFLPNVLRPLYLGWVYAAYPVGWVISHLILGLTYYGVLTPIGLIMRLAGHDPMKRQLDRSADTYWSPHTPAEDTSRYFRQF